MRTIETDTKKEKTRMRKIVARLALVALGLAAVPSMFAVNDTATTTLGVTVSPEATIAVTASPTLAKGTTEFESYTGNTTFTYRVRTNETGGGGSITALVTTEFLAASNITTADLSHVASTSGV